MQVPCRQVHTAAGGMRTAWHERLLDRLRADLTCLLTPHCPRADAKNDDMAAAQGWAAAAASLRSGLHSPTAGGLYRRSRLLCSAQLLKCAQAIATFASRSTPPQRFVGCLSAWLPASTGQVPRLSMGILTLLAVRPLSWTREWYVVKMYHCGAFMTPRQASYTRRTCACSTEDSKHRRPSPRRLLQQLDKVNIQACKCFRALQDNETICCAISWVVTVMLTSGWTTVSISAT